MSDPGHFKVKTVFEIPGGRLPPNGRSVGVVLAGEGQRRDVAPHRQVLDTRCGGNIPDMANLRERLHHVSAKSLIRLLLLQE